MKRGMRGALFGPLPSFVGWLMPPVPPPPGKKNGQRRRRVMMRGLQEAAAPASARPIYETGRQRHSPSPPRRSKRNAGPLIPFECRMPHPSYVCFLRSRVLFAIAFTALANALPTTTGAISALRRAHWPPPGRKLDPPGSPPAPLKQAEGGWPAKPVRSATAPAGQVFFLAPWAPLAQVAAAGRYGARVFFLTFAENAERSGKKSGRAHRRDLPAAGGCAPGRRRLRPKNNQNRRT